MKKLATIGLLSPLVLSKLATIKIVFVLMYYLTSQSLQNDILVGAGGAVLSFLLNLTVSGLAVLPFAGIVGA